jgi:alpha-1,2-mannosyltransferase
MNKESSIYFRVDPSQHSKIKLIMAGSCRNAEDEQRVSNLKKLSQELNIEKFVEFRLNISFEELQNVLAQSAVGLHSMKEEHFGIGKREFEIMPLLPFGIIF